MVVERLLPNLGPGSVLGHFKIEGFIGAGGMGVVFRARDLRLDRVVALKVLNDRFLRHHTARMRFLREARLAAGITHSNIATIHEVDEQQGNFFIAMELVPGGDLKSRLDDGPLPIEQIVAIGRQTCEGLAAAHAGGVIHRDIKSANIMVTPSGQVKLLDFGLAKALQEDLAGLRVAEPATPAQFSGLGGLEPFGEPMDAREKRTGVGVALGTPCYMAPEQAEGRNLDARTDVYSLGVVLYEATTGHLPFKGSTDQEILHAVRFEEPSPVHESRPGIPSDFSRIIEKCLAKSPEDRYPSATALGNALADFAESRLVTSVWPLLPTSIASHFRDRRRRRWAAAGALLAAFAAVGFVSWLVSMPRSVFPSEHRRVVVAAFENETSDSDFNGTLEAVLSVQLDQSSKFVVLPPEEIRAILKQMGLDTPPSIDYALARQICLRDEIPVLVTGKISKLGDEYLITATLWNVPDNKPFSTHQQRASGKDRLFAALDGVAASMRQKLGEAAQAIRLPQAPAELWTSSSWEALHAYGEALKRDQEDDVTGAIVLLKRATDLDPDFAMAYARLGRIYDALGSRPEAVQALESAMKRLERLTPKEKGFVQANYYQATDQHEEMLAVLQPLASLYPHDPNVLSSLGSAFGMLGDYREASRTFEEAIALSPRALPFRYSLTNTYLLAGEYESADEALQELRAIDPESRFLDYSMGYRNLLQGNLTQAIEHFEDYATSPDPARRGRGYYHLVNAYLLSGRYQRAVELLNERLAFGRSRKQPSIEAESLILISRIDLELGRPLEARDNIERALGFPLEAQELLLAGEVLARAGFLDAARSVRERLSQEAESLARQRFLEQLSGEIELAKGETEAALPLLKESVELTASPSWSEPLARALHAGGDLEAALSEYLRIVSNKGAVFMTQHWGPPLYAESLFRIGEIQERLGARGEARRYFEEYLRLRASADETVATVRVARARLARLPNE